MTEEAFAGDAAATRALIARLRAQLGAINGQLKDAQRQARREYAREYYTAHRDEYLEDQKRQRAKRREADPERYRAQRREAARRWTATHRDEINAANRRRYQTKRVEVTEKRRRKYWADPEAARRKRRESYAAQKERDAAVEANLRASATYRVELGLPVFRLHPVAAQTRRRNLAQADEFFARPRGEADLSRLRAEGATPPELLTAWERDSRRARAAYHLAAQGEELARLGTELDRVEKRRDAGTAAARAAREIEEARLDAIGRQINDRLRRYERRTAPHGADPAAPHAYLTQPHQSGLQR